ncbi:MAG: hypothetical protein WCD79_00035 [Chthoniobacteraceae bacterium]
MTGTHDIGIVARVQKTRRPYYALIVGLLGISGFGLSSQAQNPGASAVDRTNFVDLSRQQSTSIQPQMQQSSLPLGVNVTDLPVSTSGDSDLGLQVLMRRKEKEEPFRFFADAAEFYTDNVALAKNHQVGDSYFFGDVGFTYQHNLTDDLAIEATVRQGFFRYSEFKSLNFDDFNGGTGLTYDWKKLWDVTFFGRYNYERFSNDDIGNSFFQNDTLTFGAQKTWTVHQRDYLYAGYSSIIGWSSPKINQRDEHGVYFGTHYNFSRNFSTDFYYRIAVFDYAVGGRTDLNQTMVASFAYIINDYAKITASASFAVDNSNQSVFDYNLFTGGGGVALQIKF